MTVDRTPSSPRTVLRKVGGPLIAYHALILVGAYLVVLGYVRGSQTLEFVGAALVAAGILTEIWVLVWSARSVRRAARDEPHEETPETMWASPRPAVESICVRCGRQEHGAQWTCPRCGGPLVRVSVGSPELDRPSSDRVP